MKTTLTFLLILFSMITFGQTNVVVSTGSIANATYTGYVNIGSGAVHDSSLTVKGGISATGGVKIKGDLTYNFIHGVGSADSTVTYSVTGTRNVYYKIIPTFTMRESDGLTLVADSVVISTAGDYTFWAWIAATTSNTNDQLRIKIYDNNTPSPTSLGRFIILSNGNDVYETKGYMWYKVALAANHNISFRISNTSASRAITIADFKIFVQKEPE